MGSGQFLVLNLQLGLIDAQFLQQTGPVMLLSIRVRRGPGSGLFQRLPGAQA
ncbi:MAG: hypothetical protein ACKN9W_00305 [Methylococcus sp.]